MTAPDAAHPDHAPEARSASEILLALAQNGTSETMTIGEVLDALEDRAFGMVMLIFALPCCLPFVYGIPQVVSIPMLLVAMQIVAGRHTLWLPESFKRRTFSRAMFRTAVLRSQRYLKWFEAISRPRLTWLTRNGPERILGLFMVIFCISIALPFPLTNSTPGVAVAIMAVGFIERDGVLTVLGAILGTVWITLLVFFAGTLLTWITHLKDFIF